jgi:hypothetical protein
MKMTNIYGNGAKCCMPMRLVSAPNLYQIGQDRALQRSSHVLKIISTKRARPKELSKVIINAEAP